MFFFIIINIILAPPLVYLAPGPIHAKAGQSIVLPKCHVTRFPEPVITWRKLTGSLPKDRITYASRNGFVTLTSAKKLDTGPCVCSAVSPLGKVSAVTTLVVWSVPKFITTPPSSIIKHPGEPFVFELFRYW